MGGSIAELDIVGGDAETVDAVDESCRAHCFSF